MKDRNAVGRVEPVATIRTESVSSSPGASSPAAVSQQGADFHVPPERAIAQLEAEVRRLAEKLATLEHWISQHQHDVMSLSVGFLSEEINGRRIGLAINPEGTTRRTGPPVVE